MKSTCTPESKMNSSRLSVQSQLMRYAYQMLEQDKLVVPLVIGLASSTWCPTLPTLSA